MVTEVGAVQTLSIKNNDFQVHAAGVMGKARDAGGIKSAVDLSFSWLDALSFQQQFLLTLIVADLACCRLTTYFDNMTSFSLFHRPTIEEKFSNIASEKHLQALLAAIFSFAMYHGDDLSRPDSRSCSVGPAPTAYWFEIADRLIVEGLEECPDEAPPICLLQAMIIVTFQKLIRGVRGQAWRSLGECVRVAYELHLHLVDLEDETDPAEDSNAQHRKDWIAAEERRRAWWALWEFDVFASTIKRLPTALDWTLNKTYLPICDEKWYNNEEMASCYLALDPAQRWKELEKSGNRSAKAWFIVINSYMRDAQLISSFPGSSAISGRRSGATTPRHASAQRAEVVTRNVRDMLTNSLWCTLTAMPAELGYHDEYLAFRATNDPFAPTSRQRECAKYSIHIMSQLTRFMLYSQTVFRTTALDTPSPRHEESGARRTSMQDIPDRSGLSNSDRQAWEHYLDAGDRIVSVVRNSEQVHVRYVNPLLANSIWCAAAAQVVCRLFGPPSIDRSLAASNFDVLRWTLNLYVSFWGVCSTLKQKLDGLESRLDQIRRASEAEMVGPGQAVRGALVSRDKLGPSILQNQDRSASNNGLGGESGFPASTNLANSQPSMQMELDNGISDPVLNFNYAQVNIPDFNFGGDDFFENLGLEVDELFTYPHQ